MSDLVERLSKEQPIRVSLRPETSVESLKAALDRGYVHILFTETRGGTELGVRLDPARLDLGTADFETKTGSLTFAGRLTLDYLPVLCYARIDLSNLRGTGHLAPQDVAAADRN